MNDSVAGKAAAQKNAAIERARLRAHSNVFFTDTLREFQERSSGANAGISFGFLAWMSLPWKAMPPRITEGRALIK